MAGNQQITLLKCTSEYPANPENANLLTIPDIRNRFKVNVGLSDHTMGIEAPIAAVTLGAMVIEKHFILNKSIGGPDAHFSLDEQEFKKMVDSVRIAEKMLGKVDYEMTPQKIKSTEFARSLFIVKDVKTGEKLTEGNVRSIRPGFGLHPKFLSSVLGKKFNHDIPRGTPLEFNQFS